MVSTAIREDPVTQYLLGFALVVFLVGSVGGVAQVIHTGGLPSPSYVATVLVPVVGLVTATALYHRLYYSADATNSRATPPSTETTADPGRTDEVEETSTSETEQTPDGAEANPD